MVNVWTYVLSIIVSLYANYKIVVLFYIFFIVHMNTFKKLFSVTAIMALLATTLPIYAMGGTSFSVELEDAYNFAAENGITSADSIDNANMYGSLTRIAMAKMMANFSMDVLGNEADTSMDCSFPDVSTTLDAQYDMGVTNACQLSLMGVGIDNFNPYGLVTRAEFGTVLSRALYGDANNGSDPYYAAHLDALLDAGIMNNISNPMMLEVRGYVMLMMQRGSDEGTTADGCSAEELLACITADDYDDCIAECSDVEEEEEEDIEVSLEKDGDLEVSLNSQTPNDGDKFPAEVSRIPFMVFDVEADNADITLYSATFEFDGLGNKALMTEITMYDENNNEVAKSSKAFGSKEEITISFDKDYVVKDGGNETITVVALLTGFAGANDYNTTYAITMTEMSTSAEDVDGLALFGAELEPLYANDTLGALDINMDSVGSSLTVGEEEILASFTVDASDTEDVELYSILFTLSGNIDDSVLGDLVLYADGQEISDNLEVIDEELVANFEYTIPQDESVDFELKGMATELLDNTTDEFEIIIESAWDVYAMWLNKGYNAPVTFTTAATSDVWTIEGAEITASFDRADLDETKDDMEDVYFGTLKLKSQGTNYTINSYTLSIKLTSTEEYSIDDVIEDVKLNSISYDASYDTAITGWIVTATFRYDDIDLDANTSVNLPIHVSILDNLSGDVSIEVSADLTNRVELEDLDNDEDYTTSESNTFFSSTDFSEKSIAVEEATVAWTEKELNTRSFVLGTQEETVYKARINIGDADAVTLDDATFTVTLSGASNTGKDLTDLIQGATLEIGSASYDDDSITANTVKFRNMDETLDAGVSNVDAYLVFHMKSIDGFTGYVWNITLSANDAEDSVGDTVAFTADTTTYGALLLLDNGDLDITVELDDDNGTVETEAVEFDKSALAGSNDRVVLGKYKLDASDEDMDIDELTFAFTGADFDESVDSYKLVIDGDETLSYTNLSSGTAVTVEFTNVDFTVSTTTNSYAYLYAMVKDIDLDDNAVESQATISSVVDGLIISYIEFEGAQSGDDETEITANITGIANTTTVVASAIAGVDLASVEKNTLIIGSNVIATFTVTPIDTDNKNEEGDTLYPVLEAFNATVTFTNATGTYFIRQVGGNNTASLNTTGLASDLGGEAEIDGETTFEIVANITSIPTPSADASAQVQIANISTDVEYFQGETLTGYDVITQFVPAGITRELTASTK